MSTEMQLNKLCLIPTLLMAFTLTACGLVPAQQDTVSVYRGLPYVEMGHQRQVADLYVPQAIEPLAAVLVIHGGGWARGEPADMQKHVERFVDQGYAVMNISYRFAPEFKHPAQVNDALAAYRWLVNNAENYNIDSQRIAVMGYSAGAHLAMMLGAQQPPDLPPIAAVIAGAGPSDVTVYPESPYLLKLIGANGYEEPAAYKDASPLSHVSADAPPTLLYHGNWDRLVEYEQSLKMANRLAELGVEHELIEMPYKGHITAFLFDGAVWSAMQDFLAKHLSPETRSVRLTPAAHLAPATAEVRQPIWL